MFKSKSSADLLRQRIEIEQLKKEREMRQEQELKQWQESLQKDLQEDIDNDN